MNENELFNKTIFKKYKILSLLGTGSFGFVFKGINIIDKTNVAIKMEDWKNKSNLLESETYLLYYLKGFGIPEVITFGVCGKYKVLIENLLGKTLGKIFYELNHNFSLKDICMIAIQLIDRFEYIHSKYIIHRDVKPDNMLVDIETNKIIYIIDFGLSKKYRSSRTGKHIKFKIQKTLTGSEVYASVNAHQGKIQSRRDDLESLGYILIFFGKKGLLPWRGLKIDNIFQRIKKIYSIKKSIDISSLCSGLPQEFYDYIKYVKSLKFEEDPDYNYLRGLFLNIMNKMNYINDLEFTWLNKNELNKKILKKNYREVTNCNIINILKRRESPRQRLYKKILNSREKDKNNNKIDDGLDENNEKKQNKILLKNNEKIMNKNIIDTKKIEITYHANIKSSKYLQKRNSYNNYKDIKFNDENVNLNIINISKNNSKKQMKEEKEDLNQNNIDNILNNSKENKNNDCNRNVCGMSNTYNSTFGILFNNLNLKNIKRCEENNIIKKICSFEDIQNTYNPKNNDFNNINNVQNKNNKNNNINNNESNVIHYNSKNKNKIISLKNNKKNIKFLTNNNNKLLNLNHIINNSIGLNNSLKFKKQIKRSNSNNTPLTNAYLISPNKHTSPNNNNNIQKGINNYYKQKKIPNLNMIRRKKISLKILTNDININNPDLFHRNNKYKKTKQNNSANQKKNIINESNQIPINAKQLFLYSANSKNKNKYNLLRNMPLLNESKSLNNINNTMDNNYIFNNSKFSIKNDIHIQMFKDNNKMNSSSYYNKDKNLSLYNPKLSLLKKNMRELNIYEYKSYK